MIKFYLEKFRKAARHPFSRDVAILQFGTVITSGLAFLTSLVFARILGPEDYGFYGLVFALAGIINIFQDIGIGQAAINLLAKAVAEKNRQMVLDVLGSFRKLSIWIGATAGVLGVLAAPWIGKFFYRDQELGNLAAIVVATTALTFFYPLITVVLQVLKRIMSLAGLEVAHKLLNVVIPIALILSGLRVSGIVWGQFLAMCAASTVGLIMYRNLASQEPLLPRLGEFWRHQVQKTSLKSFFRYGFAIAVDRNLVKVLGTLPLLFAGYVLVTNSAIGFYKLAFGYMSIPVVLLKPLSRLLSVQLPQTQTLASDERLFRRFFQVSFLSFGLTLLLTLPMLAAGPYLIRFFFPEFTPAIKLIYPFAFYPALVALGVGVGPMFRTLNKMGVIIKINILNLALMIPLAYFFISRYALEGLIGITLFFVFFPTILTLGYFYSLYKKLKT